MFGIVPWNRDERNLFNYFDDIEKNFFGPFESQTAAFRTDIEEQDDKFVLSAELPGFNKEDIKIDIDDGMLTISAEHNIKEEKKTANYVRQERRYGKFTRSFDITNIVSQDIKASYNNGILSLDLPKLKPVSEPTRQIEIE